MRKLYALVGVVLLMTSFLWYGVGYYHFEHRNNVLNVWNSMQMEIGQSIGRSLQFSFETDNVCPVITTENAFKRFVEPVQLLNGKGLVCVYENDKFIFGNCDVYGQYPGSSLKDIFREKEMVGAYGYEPLIDGILAGKEGMTSFYWDNERGKVHAAWTTFHAEGKKYSIVITTPENDILTYTDMLNQYKRELVGASIITVLMFLSCILLIKNVKETNDKIKSIEDLRQEIISIKHAMNNK